MKYRVATHKDHTDIEDVIASTGYYPPVDVKLMDGTFIVAEKADGEIVGCVWIMHYGRNSYLDYLAVRPKYAHLGVGVRLTVKAMSVLKRRGVKYIRACVHLANTETLRIAKALGAIIHAPYAMCFKDIGG